MWTSTPSVAFFFQLDTAAVRLDSAIRPPDTGQRHLVELFRWRGMVCWRREGDMS